MNLSQITAFATQKTNFTAISDYVAFCQAYLDFAAKHLQAVIVSQNENHYQFFQYKETGITTLAALSTGV